MFDTAFLDIGIGVAFVFLSLSLVCSGVREGIEQILKTRAKDLERGLRGLLEDPNGDGITKWLFNHPQIATLFRGAAYDPGKLVGTTSESDVSTSKTMPLAGRKNLPSYIPATNFSSAIFDLVLRGPAGAESPYPVPPLTIGSLKSAATTFSDETVKRVLLSAIDSANDQIDKVRASVEDWFNATMERAGGWYKRRTQLILFVIGLIVAVVLNIDAITIVKRLSTDQTLTAALVAQAKQVAKTDSTSTAPVDLSKVQSGLETLGIPMGWATGSKAWPVPGPQGGCILGEDKEKTWKCQASLGVWESAQIVVGWLITAFAVMLGAPFWFDVLSKFITIRSTLKPADEADKKSADTGSQSSPTNGDSPDAAKPQESTPAGYEPNAWDTEKLDQAAASAAGAAGAPLAGAEAAAAPAPSAEETPEQRQAREQAGVL